MTNQPDDLKYTVAEPSTLAGPTVFFTAALVIGLLYFAREICVPLAVAGLVSFVLSPPVMWLRHRGLPRVPSVIIVVLLAVSAMFALGTVVGDEAISLAKNLPSYETNLDTKLHSLHDAFPNGGVVARFSGMVDNLRSDFGSGTAMPAPATGAQAASPVPVLITSSSFESLQLIQSLLSPLVGPLVTAGLVIVFVIFFLLRREDLRDRVIRLTGYRDLHRATLAMNDAAERVSRYLAMQLVVNTCFAVPIGLGLWAIGIPNAPLWGVLSLLLRFMPYIGTWISALFPFVLAVAVDPGWSMLIYVGALYTIVELITSNFLEPWLYGASTGLQPLAVLVAATFWTWLWGPIGLLLSTPLTVCLVVLGRYSPSLRFLPVLFGNEAPLSPVESFYQRLLADDAAESTEQAEIFTREHPLVAFYDQVVLPAIALAQNDSDRNFLDREHRAKIKATLGEVIESLAPEPGEDDAPPASDTAMTAMCLGARNDLDEASAALLAQLLEYRGLNARMEGGAAEHLDIMPAAQPTPIIACVSFISSNSAARGRFIVRRLRRRLPRGSKIVVCFWSLAPLGDGERRDRLEDTGADAVATTLADAVEQVLVLCDAPVALPVPVAVTL